MDLVKPLQYTDQLKRTNPVAAPSCINLYEALHHSIFLNKVRAVSITVSYSSPSTTRLTFAEHFNLVIGVIK